MGLQFVDIFRLLEKTELDHESCEDLIALFDEYEARLRSVFKDWEELPLTVVKMLGRSVSPEEFRGAINALWQLISLRDRFEAIDDELFWVEEADLYEEESIDPSSGMSFNPYHD